MDRVAQGGTPKRVEDPFLMVRLDAQTIVGHRDMHTIIHDAGADRHVTGSAAVLDRIAAQIQ